MSEDYLSGATMDPPQFEYAPLSLVDQEIRLVTLHPGSWTDAIRCDIATHPFDDDIPAYEALSYVWGDPNRVIGISLNDKTFDVTENLWLALRRLRHQHAARVLWIDALSIHQLDNTEKSHQVAMMGKIYSRCSQGLCWLGEDELIADAESSQPPTSIGGQQAIELLDILAAYKSSDHLPCFVFDEARDARPVPELRLHFVALDHVFGLPWWRRIWVVQELALPKRVTFLYASESFSYDTLYLAAKTMYSHSTGCCKSFFWDDSKRDRLSDAMTSQYFGGTIRALTRVRRLVGRRKYPSLAYLRNRLSSSYASDRRDLFYALIGLSDPKTESLVPDYTLPFQTSFVRAVAMDIANYGRLDILTGPRLLDQSSGDVEFSDLAPAWSSMPTWIPPSLVATITPMTPAADLVYNRFSMIQKFSSSGDVLSSATLVRDSALLVRAIRISALQEVSVPADKCKLGTEVGLWAAMVGLDSPSSWPEEQPAASELQDSFWKTLMCDYAIRDSATRRKRGSRPDDLEYPAMRRFILKSIGCPDPEDEDAPLKSLYPPAWPASMANMSLAERLMFTTDDGRVGLAPDNALPGDEVYVLIGSPVPFILRPVQVQGDESPDGTDSARRRFTVVGDGYFHGVMYGEALEGKDGDGDGDGDEDSWEDIELW